MPARIGSSPIVGAIGSLPLGGMAIGGTIIWPEGPSIPDPLVHYDFHEGSGSTAADVRGSWPNLTAVDSGTAWSGQNAASRFTVSGVTLPTPWTFHFDVYLDGFAGAYTYFLTANSSHYLFTFNSSKRLAFYQAASVESADNAVTVGDQTLTWVNDGSSVALYRNGAHLLTGAHAATPSITGLGIAGEAGGSWPTGDLIRDLRVWDSALTSDQVAGL